MFLFQRYFHFFYITKASLYYIIKRTSSYIGNINSGVVNSFAILTFGSLQISIDSFVSISTIALYYLLIRSVWFGYKIYDLRSIIPTTNANWVLSTWLLLLSIIEANLKWNIFIWLQSIESEIEPKYSSRDSFLTGSTLVKLILYDAPTRFKTFLNRGVLLESILCFSTGSFFAPFKCSWNLDKKFEKS